MAGRAAWDQVVVHGANADVAHEGAAGDGDEVLAAVLVVQSEDLAARANDDDDDVDRDVVVVVALDVKQAAMDPVVAFEVAVVAVVVHEDGHEHVDEHERVVAVGGDGGASFVGQLVE